MHTLTFTYRRLKWKAMWLAKDKPLLLRRWDGSDFELVWSRSRNMTARDAHAMAYAADIMLHFHWPRRLDTSLGKAYLTPDEIKHSGETDDGHPRVQSYTYARNRSPDLRPRLDW